jgi:hypothetical protein
LGTRAGAIDALEQYVREADIETVYPLKAGEGHPGKMTLVLCGGVGVVGKPARDDRTLKQVGREVAARVLAVELGFDELVPVTVMRNMPDGPEPEADATVGSAQLIWPLFEPAIQSKLNPSSCPGGEAASWRIAVFDWLVSNGDRHWDNWGVIKPLVGPPRAVLIDHGHAFEPGGLSEFISYHDGQPIPEELLRCVEAFVSNRDDSRLFDFLKEDEAAQVFDNAERVLVDRRWMT